METNKNQRIPRSIRTRLWQWIGVMAVVSIAASAVAYYVVAGFTTGPVLPAAVAVILAAISMLIIGRSFVERIASPVDAAYLAAKSSERNPSAIAPAATGISETDEILRCLHRSSRQLMSYASLMEMVAAGNTADAVLPMDSPDKLTTAFQKLVQKVVESVDAKRKLDELLLALADLEEQLPGLFETRPYREIRAASAVSRIADALNEIAARGDRELRKAKDRIAAAESILLSANLGVRNGLLASDASVQSLSRAVSTLKSMPDHVKSIAELCEPANLAAGKVASSFQAGIESGRTLSEKASHIQRYQNELNRKLRKLRERSQSISDAARSVEDLARRSNLLALNTSIQADNRSDAAGIGAEFRTLSDRAHRAHKEITEIERSITQEIDDSDTVLRLLLAESADVSIQLTSNLELLEMFEPVINGLSGASDLIKELVNKNNRDREELARAMTGCYFDLEKIGPQLLEAEHAIIGVRRVFEETSEEIRSDRTITKDRFEPSVPTDRPPLEISGEN